MSLKVFIDASAQGIMYGLFQELKIAPNVHYEPRAHNAARVVTFKLVGVNPHYLRQIYAMQQQLTFWAGLDDKRPVRLGWDGLSIVIEIPKPGSYWKKVTMEYLESSRAIKRGPVATLGLDLADRPRRINFGDDAMAHLFITGQTRSGKTNAQRLIGWNLAHHCPDSQMIIFDVAKRGYKWSDFGRVANLAHPIVKDLAEADRVLAWASQEIDRRANHEAAVAKTFILIDELKALLDDSKVAEPYLSRLASVGGEFGLHLILSTQYPQIKMLGSAELKRNVTTRLCGKVDDATAAQNALGIAGSGAEGLQGYGDMLLKDFDGLTRLTVAKIEPAHVERLPRRESIPLLPLPDSDQVNGGPPQTTHNEPLCVEPEHAALALIEPMGIGRLRDEIVARGLAKTFSKGRAQRTREFAEAQRRWILENAPKPDRTNVGVTFSFLDSQWVEI